MNIAILRLALAGSRSAVGRLAGIMAGVAVGVCLLLLLWGAADGLAQRDARGAWLRETGGSAYQPPVDGDPHAASVPIPLGPDTMLVARPAEHFRDSVINRVDVAALPDTSARIPGIPAPPGPGEYYASPALQQLIEQTPADQLADRFGSFAGTIGKAALPGPDSLIVVTGAAESELRNSNGGLGLVSEFTTNPYGENAVTYRTAFLVGGLAVLFPILLLISIVSNLGAAQRRERFATLRLIGATPGTVARISAAEAAVPSLAGALLGVALSTLVRPLAAEIPVNGTRVFIDDLATDWTAAAVVAAAVVLCSMLAAGHRTLKAGTGPLGVTRAMPERMPTPRQALPLLAGFLCLGALAFAAGVPELRSPWWEIPFMVGGFVLIMAGLVIIGPWLTLLVSRVGLRFARSATSVIASSRIAATPSATFRSVAGLVIAVFVVSIFAGGSSAIRNVGVPAAVPGVLQPASVRTFIDPAASPDAVDALAAQVNGTAGLHATVAYGSGGYGSREYDGQIHIEAAEAVWLGLTEGPDAGTAVLDAGFLNGWNREPVVASASPAILAELTPFSIIVHTDAAPESVDRARTLLVGSGVAAGPPMSPLDDSATGSTRLVAGLSALAYVGMFVAVSISAISLAVSTASAMLDRKRILGLMRLMGMPASSLRRIVTREAAVPLLTVLLLAVGLGFLVAWMMVASLGPAYRMDWPGADYFTALGLSLGIGAAALVSTFGLLRTSTGMSVTRFE